MAEPPDLCALVDGERVAVTADGTLPRLDGSDEWRSWPGLLALAGTPAAPVGPSVRAGAGPEALTVHVVAPLTDAPPTDRRWVPIDAVGDGPAVAQAIRSALAPPTGGPRPDWYRTGWQAEVEAWVDGLGVRRTGPGELVKLWNLSAVLRLPTDDGPLFFKAVCDWFAAEPRVTAVVAGRWPERVPRLVAVEPDRGWMLMRPFAETSFDDEDLPTAVEVATAFARLQQDSVPLVDDLLAAGAMDRRLEGMLDGLLRVVHEGTELGALTPEEREAVRDAHPRWAAHLEELAACGLPWTLAHGDLHLGNVARSDDGYVFFDWTDACVSHPFLDGAHLGRSLDDALLAPAVAAYADAWRAAYPEADVDRAAALAPTADRLFQLATYDGIARATEDAAKWELGGQTVRILRRLLDEGA